MSIKFTKLSSILLVPIVAGIFAIEVKAEEPTATPVSVVDVFKDAYFEHTGDNYHNSSPVGELNTIFGFNGFPDNQISADGKLLDMLYQDLMAEQSQSGTSIKTRDLSNPYTTSLQENPGYIGY